MPIRLARALVLVLTLAIAAATSGDESCPPSPAAVSFGSTPAPDSGGCGCGGGGGSRSADSAAASEPAKKPFEFPFLFPSLPARPLAPPVVYSDHPSIIATRTVLIRSGSYLMGASESSVPVQNRRDGESPVRLVSISESFEIDAYEISVAQFAAFVAATRHLTKAEIFGWSTVFEPQITAAARDRTHISENGSGARHHPSKWWRAVNGASWRSPLGVELNLNFSSLIATRASRLKRSQRRTLREWNSPAVHVSWHDAVAYCAWRDAGSGGMRLPTEAEWEYVARGGRVQNTFPWGQTLLTPNHCSAVALAGVTDERLRAAMAVGHRSNIWSIVNPKRGESFPTHNSKADGYYGVAPIDSYGPQNEFGVYNMAGNVWEWTSDRWSTRFTSDAVTDPTGPDTSAGTGSERVKRGGSFLCHESYCFRYRTSARSHNSEDTSSNNIGFRCVRTVN